MFKNSLILLLFITQSCVVIGQDQKAKAILDDVTKTTKVYKTIVAEYNLTILDKNKKQTERTSWKIRLKSGKFKLENSNNTIVCDGKTMWTYQRDSQKVTITNYEPKTEKGIDITNILTFYENGFKCKYEKEMKLGGKTLAVIDLFPSVKNENPAYNKIKVHVDKIKKQMMYIVAQMTNGTTQSYELKNFISDTELANELFVFNLKGFSPNQIVDKR